jgi:glucosamine--fructose-6-phosphate aminotransferase (isomerizing)
LNPGFILKNEIEQQPALIDKLISLERNNVSEIASRIKGKYDYILIAARGTSDNAARYAQYLFGINNQMQVALATPSIISVYEQSPKMKGYLVIGISQSGESPDIVSVLDTAKKQGCPTISITNDPGSPLAGISDFVIPLHAGEEKAIAATKTYTTSLAALAMLSIFMDFDEKRINELKKIPETAQILLHSIAASISRTERYRYMDRCSVIGRGYNYSTAFEVALKIKELTRVTAEPYSSADFRHGPIATAQSGSPVILIAPSGMIFTDLKNLSASLDQKRAEMIIISDNKELLSFAKFPLEIPTGIPEWLSPLISVIPGQLFANNLALCKGLDVDHPEGLSKITRTI